MTYRYDGVMGISPDGRFVRVVDYDEVVAERDALAAQVKTLKALEDAIRHDRAMFEGTSDEFNPMGTLVTQALAVIDAARKEQS